MKNLPFYYKEINVVKDLFIYKALVYITYTSLMAIARLPWGTKKKNNQQENTHSFKTHLK